MKTLLIAGVAALISSSAWADERTPVALPEVDAARTEAPVAPGTEAIPGTDATSHRNAIDAAPSSFCGQALVQGWLWQTEVGKALRLRQQAALKQAQAGAYPGMGVAREKGETSAPPATQPDATQGPAAGGAPEVVAPATTSEAPPAPGAK